MKPILTFTSELSIFATEKRAPTDESVRLLREMEDRAFGEVLSRFKLADNQFKAEILSHSDPNMPINQKLSCIFDLNGKRLMVQVDYGLDKIESLRALANAIAEKIAVEIVSKALKGMPGL